MSVEALRKPTLFTVLKKLFILGLVVTALLLLLSFLMGRELVKAKNRPVNQPSTELPIQDLILKTEDGLSLKGWYISADEHRRTVLLLHPKGNNRLAMIERGIALFEKRYDVLIIDFRGHGESDAALFTSGWDEARDVDAALSFLKEENPEHPIGVIGWSLGGAATLFLEDLEVDAVVLESVFPSLFRAVENRVAMRLGPLAKPLSFLICWQIKPWLGISYKDLMPISHVGGVGAPVLIVSGSEDLYTTFEESELLAKATGDLLDEHLVFEGAGHENFYSYDPELYESKVFSFLERNMPLELE